ncbi:organic solute transporter subunit alpha-like isoform X2 [Scleropages formosus]|uniref:organic solute transporter subunit alpha-like isoform X2 n=1 Tax=Scleropages formosus TaxID=113540 RepID=UPI0010FA7532|nr:organic solute transporter subunit alpha-like isoform X2 [Scleropages formosus]
MERNGSRGAACLQEPPSSEVLISNMDMTMGSLYAVLTLMAVAGSLVYLEEIIYITRKISPSYKRTTYIWVTGAAPVIAATSCIGMWIPRSSMFTDFTASIRSLTVLKWGTLQAALLRPTLMFFAIVLWTNGTYQQGKMKVNGAFPWITALSVATFILSLWPIGILFSQAKSNLSKHNIVPKFALNQSVAILSQAQGGVISLLVSTGTIVCAPPFSARARGTFMHQQLVVMEMFIVILVARFYYRRRYNDHGIEKPFTKPLAKENVPGDADRQDGGVFMQPLVSSTHWV